MLREVIDVRQDAATYKKQWFTDESFDLFVWLDQRNQIVAYQLAYAKNTDREHIVSWQRDSGYQHNQVDAGDKPGKHKETPILVPDGSCDTETIVTLFRQASADIPTAIAEFVEKSVRNYPG